MRTRAVAVLGALVMLLGLGAQIEPVAAATHQPEPVLYFDMVVDEARRQIYGSDRDGDLVHVIDMVSLDVLTSIPLGAGSQPTGLDISGDGSELAVALFGLGEIAFIDLDTLTITASPVPDVTVGPNRPYDVLYGRSGRLYTVGNPGSSGLDYVHVFDTNTHTEIGRSSEIMRAAPRLAMTADQNTLYVSQVIFSPQKIYRFDISTDTPAQTAAGPHGPVQVNTLAVKPDGSQVYSSRGQVWSGDLSTQLGSFTPNGEEIEYSAASNRFYITAGTQVTEYDAEDYSIVRSYPLPGTGGPARIDTTGTIIYVNTDLGVVAIISATPIGSNGQGGDEANSGNGQGANGHGTNGHGTNGQGTNGQGTNGQGTNGQGANGQTGTDQRR